MTSLLFSSEPSGFPDRRDDGRKLARQLDGFRDSHPVVVGVAPEGMPLAAEIARALDAPLDAVATDCLTLGSFSDQRFGVAAEGGVVVFDPECRERIEANPESVDAVLIGTEARMQRRATHWHRGNHRESLRGRTVLLVAAQLIDQLAAEAAVCAVRDRGAANIVFAAPKARLAAVRALEDWVDEVIGLELMDDEVRPTGPGEDSVLVSDETVWALLRENRRNRPQARPQRTQ